MRNVIAILGIHTDIGKTIASAVIAEALQADYWKPVQAGGLDRTDTHIVSSLLTNGAQRVHPEAYRLTQPMSPHAAAAIDNITIDHTQLPWPETSNTLLVETAGGILSPMTDNATMVDFVQHYRLPAILISQNYLGSINHTLSGIEVLKSRQVPLLGVVINGEPNNATEQYIETYSGVPIIARVPFLQEVSRETVSECAQHIRPSLLQHLSNVNY